MRTLEVVSIECRAAGPAGCRRRGRAGRRARVDAGRAGRRPPSGSVGEDPRRRTHRRGGRRAPARASTRSMNDSASSRDELSRIMRRLRRADRPQPGPGRCRADRRRHAPRGHRSGRGRRRQRRPRCRHAGRHRRGQRPDRQHHRRGGAHHGAALRRRPADRSRGRVAPPRRVEARPVHRAWSCAAGRSASSVWARSARPIAVRARGRWR